MNVMMTLIEAIMLIVGAASAEELDEHETERFVWLNDHPLNINSASRKTLSESGLLTDFQLVSLLDYIAATGPVLSRSELSVVDGFDAEIAEALSFFVSFGESQESGWWRSDGRVYSDVSASLTRGPASAVSSSSGAYGLACHVDKGAKYEFGLSGAGGWSRKIATEGTREPVKNSLSALSLSSSVMLGNRVKIYAGDFNLRFGQGLAVWNTMVMDDPSSARALIRRPTGIKLSRSLTGNYAQTGVGTTVDVGSFTFSSAVTVPSLKKVLLGEINTSRKKNDVAGLQGLFNCNWWHRRFSLGATSVVTGIPSAGGTRADNGADTGQQGSGARWRCTADFSVDFRGCFGGFDLASELAGGVGMPFRAVFSSVSPQLWEHFRLGASLMYSKSKHLATFTSEFSSRNGHAASLSCRLRHVIPKTGTSSTSDSGTPNGTNDCRVDARWRFKWNDASSVALRLRENVSLGPVKSNVFRCRGDVTVGYSEIWASSASVSFSHSGKWGMVAFVEESCRATGRLTAYLRGGIFSVDDWAGRIYIYEHDIPGRFNVPAMYGRGVWTSFFTNWKICRMGSLSSRVAYYSYPFMAPSKRKPDKVEGRIMLTLRF